MEGFECHAKECGPVSADTDNSLTFFENRVSFSNNHLRLKWQLRDYQ